MENNSFLKPYDKEYMRLAMLKHEETFKEQVYELHRLYRIQKIMMSNIHQSNNIRPNNYARNHQEQLWSFNQNNNIFRVRNTQQQQSTSVMKLDHLERPATAAATDEYVIAESRGRGSVVVVGGGGIEHIDESEIELTLGLGPASYNNNNNNNNNRRRKKRNDQTPLTSDQSGPTSFSSSSTGSSHINRTTSTSFTKQKTAREVVQVQEMSLGYQSGEKLRQESLKQPPWFFQVLSLNTS